MTILLLSPKQLLTRLASYGRIQPASANQEAKDYKQLSTLRLPRVKPVNNTDKLYELEEDVYTSRVKVHYVGYDSEHDEWRDKADIVHLKTQPGKRRHFIYTMN